MEAEMKSPTWFKPEINANFILTLVMLLGGGYGLYYGIALRLDLQDATNRRQMEIDAEQTKRIEEGQRSRREDMQRLEAQMRAVEQKADAKLEILQRDIADVKGTLREVNANIQWIVRQQGGTPTFTIPPR